MIGGRGWNRTTNLSIKSRMLCQLSYASIFYEPEVGRIIGAGQAHPANEILPRDVLTKIFRGSLNRGQKLMEIMRTDFDFTDGES